MALWSTQFANRFISLATSEPLTHMQIQKLVYISHGWSLALKNQKLTIDSPEAWRYGPVYRLVWDNLKYAGEYPITKEIPENRILPYADAELGEWDESSDEIVEAVFRFYGGLEAFQLSALTHKEGTPWKKIYRPSTSRQGMPIPSSMIREHFLELSGNAE